MRWTRTGRASDLEDRRGGSRGVQVGRLELPADCYAGVWARSVFDRLEDGDIEEAMTASQAVGDDRLQKQAGQRVNPDSFTHGSSAQRLEWFKRGSANGEPADCDTFSGDV